MAIPVAIINPPMKIPIAAPTAKATPIGQINQLTNTANTSGGKKNQKKVRKLPIVEL